MQGRIENRGSRLPKSGNHECCRRASRPWVHACLGVRSFLSGHQHPSLISPTDEMLSDWQTESFTLNVTGLAFIKHYQSWSQAQAGIYRAIAWHAPGVLGRYHCSRSK